MIQWLKNPTLFRSDNLLENAMSDKELRKELAQKHKKIAELQEEAADMEGLLPKEKQYKVERGYSFIYGDKFEAISEQLSKAEAKVMWCVKREFDKHPASKAFKTEVSITTPSIRAKLAEEGTPMNPDTARKAIKTLVDLGFIRPMSDSSKKGRRSIYRMNPFIASGLYAEPLGKLQLEWKMLFPTN